MRDFAAEVLGGRQIEYTLTAQGLDPAHVLPVEVRQNLYLIFKEAINNIARHSTARTVEIRITNGPLEFTMRVANDGVPREEEQKASGHYGLQNMALRARRIGAELTTEGPPGFAIVVQRRKI
jgi:signal transduction histidine kinase